VHAILDTSAHPFLRELAERVHARARETGRSVHLIAESDLGDPRVIRPARTGGYDMDAQWLDDFHHALHTLLTGESDGYYADFGGAEVLARSFREGFAYTGQYSHFRKRRHGAPAPDARPEQFVVFAQNHDQVGNRFRGDRLAATLGLEQLKLAAATVLLSPFTPLLFMGEEYGETAPFPYFVSHLDAGLVEAVRTGRREEFAAFGWTTDPPDPQSMDTFASARLDRTLRDAPTHRTLLAFHRTLLRLRCAHRVLTEFERIETHAAGELVVVTRRRGREVAVLALNFSREAAISGPLPAGAGWSVLLDSAAAPWSGPGGSFEAAPTEAGAPQQILPHSALLLLRET
jgi:maltooligosyltrehalose trehalohydrolase